MDAQEKELWRLSTLLVEYQALFKFFDWKVLPRNHSSSTQKYKPVNAWGYILSEQWVNINRGGSFKNRPSPWPGWATNQPTWKFWLLHRDGSDLPTWPSICIVLGRLTAYHEEWTPWIGASWVSGVQQGPTIHPELQKDLSEEGFGHSLQAAATKFKKLWEPKVAKLKGGYSSDASLVFQLWLKDILVYVLECHLSQWEANQLVKHYTSEHALLKVEYYLGLMPKSKQSFQELIDHLSLMFQSCETVSSLIGVFIIRLK